MGDLWCGLCDYLGENLPRYNGTALYKVQANILHQTIRLSLTSLPNSAQSFTRLFDMYSTYEEEQNCMTTWWRHQMESFSALPALCVGNSPVTGEFPTQRPVTRNVDVFFDLCLNKRLSKHSWGWWFETPSRSLWRHWNDFWWVCCAQPHEQALWRLQRGLSLVALGCIWALQGIPPLVQWSKPQI